jgi:putative hemolysin
MFAEAGMSPAKIPLTKGPYQAQFFDGSNDIAAAQALRTLAFGTTRPDRDAFDGICAHLLVHDTLSGMLVCCMRLLTLPDGRSVARSYSAQYYGLDALEGFSGRLVEIGRFCIHPDWNDPDILRVAWGALTAYVDENDIEMLFGCSSFVGTETSAYLDTFAILKARYLAPNRWLPQIKSPEVFQFDTGLHHEPDVKKALQLMPPLLRTYLMMGGWVSDHAVVDRQMNTLHIFTGLEIDAIPATRKRLLRAMAG